MPLLALLQNIHIRVLLVLIRFPVFDLLEHAIFIPLKGAWGGRIQQMAMMSGSSLQIGVQLVNPGIVGSSMYSSLSSPAVKRQPLSQSPSGFSR